MSRRESIYVVKKVPVEGADPDWEPPESDPHLPNPNKYVGQITVEVRVFFPPHTKNLKVMSVYDQAFAEVEQQFQERFLLPELYEEYGE